MGRYDLTALGWLLFERLCADWLERAAGEGPAAWRGSADISRHAVVDGGLEAMNPSLVGPTLVATAWIHERHIRRQIQDTLQVAEVEKGKASPGSLLVLTNLPAAPVREQVGPSGVVLGEAELSEALDADLQLRLAAPSVLGVREGGLVLDRATSERSHFDIYAALELARVFVPTRPYSRTLGVLRAHRFCVLTGPPEMGKTAAARMIALALMTGGWEVHECTQPDEVAQRWQTDRRQVFVADDAFGSTEYRPDSAERWARALPDILHRSDERHWLIWTSRPTPLRTALRAIHRERGGERFPAPAEVHVDAADLDTAEKALVLLRHAKVAALHWRALQIVREQGPKIVDHEHFTPERIRRFVAGPLPELARAEGDIGAAVQREIEHPTKAMATSYLALDPSQRAVLLAMLDCPPGVVAERELAAAARRHSEAGLDRAPFDLVDRLTDHFLRLPTSTSVTWVHPSWRDLVIAELAGDPDARRRFLSRCGRHGALLALSTAGGETGTRRLPLLMDDADWDALADTVARLAVESDERSLAELLGATVVAIEHCAYDHRAAGELRSIGVLAMDFGKRAHPSHSPVDVALIEAWLRFAALLPDPQLPPWLPATWVELLPIASPDPHSPADLTRYEDWLVLATAVHQYDADVLERLGFPGDQVRIWRELAADAARIAATHSQSPQAARLSRLVMRAGRLLGEGDPALTGAASWVETTLEFDERQDHEETVRRASVAISRDHHLVKRVLDDLAPRRRPRTPGR